MDDFLLTSTFSILIDEMLEEGNYEIMEKGIYVNFSVNFTFISRTELTVMRNCKDFPRTTRDKVRAVLDEIDDYRKEQEGGAA